MSMLIGNNFKRQKQIYMFYTLLPVLLLGEILIFYYTDPVREWGGMLLFLSVLVQIAEAVIIPVQIFSEICFRKQIKRLTEEEKQAFEKSPLRIGPILVNDAFIVEYRMFRKRVISISDIFRANYREQKYKTQARGISVSHVHKDIVLLRIGKKQIVMKAPKTFMGQETDAVINSVNNVIEGKGVREDTKKYYSQYNGDFPFYGIFFLTLTGVIFLIYRCYIPFMDLFVNAKDRTAYFLFHAGYDRYFQIGAVVVICFYAIGCFAWKYHYLGFDFDSNAGNFVIPVTVLVLMFLNTAFVKDYGDISAHARADFAGYKKGNYGYTETSLIDIGNDFSRSGNMQLESMTEELGIEIQICKSADKSMEFMYVGEKLNILKDKEYQVVYLENTGIIVEIR